MQSTLRVKIEPVDYILIKESSIFIAGFLFCIQNVGIKTFALATAS